MPATLACRNCGHDLTGLYAKTVETPFPDLLKLESNGVLPAALSDITHIAISAANRDILRLKAELRRKRSERQVFVIAAHKAIISPICRTPPELITEIFLHYVEGKPGSPVLLASICKKLRSIALSSPQLWASFRMNVKPNKVRSQTAFAEMWLSRAGKCPLNINLANFPRNQIPPNASATIQPLMDAFIARCEQWQTVELTLPSALIRYLSEGTTNRLERLEKLTFGHGVNAEEGIPICFLTMPMLRSLKFTQWLLDPAPQLPWQQLQELSFHTELTARACLDVLAAASSLQKCHLGLLLTEMQNIHILPSITLPLLQCMSIYVCSEVDLSRFLSAISLPAIEELSISVPTDHMPPEGPLPALIGMADAIVSMISRGSLLKLTLDMPSPTWYATPANTISVLRAAPKLLEASLIGTTAEVLSREFVDQFNPQDARLVPGLQTLNVEVPWGQLDLSIAMDMIEGRCLPNYRSSLKQVVLRGKYMEDAPEREPALQSRLLLVKHHSGIDVQLFSLEDLDIYVP